MTHHQINVDEQTGDAEAKDQLGPLPVQRKAYKVKTKTGMFKNGKQYNQGDMVELDEKTAKAAAEAGDIEMEGEPQDA